VGRFIVLLSSGAPCVCVCYTALRARGGCPLQGYCLLSLFTWHTQRLHLRQRQWTKLKCWTQVYWLFGGKFEYVTPLAHLQDLPQLNWRHLRHHYQCLETVQLFRWTVGISAFCLACSFYNNNTHSHTIKWLLVVKQSETESLSLLLNQKCEKKNAWGHSKQFCLL